MNFKISPQIRKEMSKALVNIIFQHTKGKTIELIQVDKDFLDDVFGVGNTVTNQIYARAKKLNKDFTLKTDYKLKSTDISVKVIYYETYIDENGKINKIYGFNDYKKPIEYLKSVSF